MTSSRPPNSSSARSSASSVSSATSSAASAATFPALIRRSQAPTPRLSSDADGLPESFVEAVARVVAVQAARRGGPLAAGHAVATVFQVCSTWRNVSRSQSLWENLFLRIWPLEDRNDSRSWQEAYIRAHCTASNLRQGRAQHHLLDYEMPSGSSSDSENGAGCRCLALSRHYLAGGFFDGIVRVFDLRTKFCIFSMDSGREDRFGPFSRAIAGLFVDDEQVVFASLDGSVFIGDIARQYCRAIYAGNVVEDGALISFAGSRDFWVGLYAGSPGRSIRVWNALTREIIYNGGDIMNSDAMRGWHSFVEQAGQIGRVRISDNSFLVTATRNKLSVLDLETFGLNTSVEFSQPMAVEAMDVEVNKLLTASYDGNARIVSLPSMELISRLHHPRVHNGAQLFGALNTSQMFLCLSGLINVWDAASGRHLYVLEEELGDVYDLVAKDGFVAVCVAESGLHLWDFTP